MGNMASLTPDPSVDATLYYFRGRGKADQIRWLLAASGISFSQRDVDTVGKFRFLASELAFGKVPMLQIDGREVVESQAILRYIARREKLAGKSDEEMVLADQIAEAVRDAVNPLLMAPFERKKSHEATGDKTAPAHVQKMKETFVKFATRFEKLLTSNDNSGYCVGTSRTYADILVAHCLTWYVEEVGRDVLDPYPALIDLQNAVISIPEVRRFIRSTLFHPIGDVGYANEVLDILGRGNPACK
jgi:glutathione S-transferase